MLHMDTLQLEIPSFRHWTFAYALYLTELDISQICVAYNF